MRIARSVLTFGLAALVAASVVSCSSTDDGTPATSPPVSTPDTSGPTGFAPSTGSSGPTGFPNSSGSSGSTGSSGSSGSPGGGLTNATQGQVALLDSSEVGGDFQSTTPDNSQTPLPCTPSEPPLDQQFPPQFKVKAEFVGASGDAAVTEELENFEDPSTVGSLFAAAEHGLGCSTATIQGTKYTLDGPEDVTDKVGVTVDKAETWSANSKQVGSSIVAVQLGTHVVVFTFTAKPTVKTADLPNPVTIIKAALSKIQAAL